MELITGNKFKKICHYSLDEYGFIKNIEPNNDEVLKIFVKIDYVHYFFSLRQDRPYILITHNGDIPVDNSYLKYMDDPYMVKWFGQNIMTIHNKLVSIPIGLANEKWPHGDENIFMEVVNENNVKDNLFYINFEITNFARNDCLQKLSTFGLYKEDRKSFKEYLRELSRSYFVISPEGNGIDCHKTWESIYLKSVPIITKSINAEFYKDYPIIIIDDWSKFNPSDFNISLYHEKWKNFNKSLTISEQISK